VSQNDVNDLCLKMTGLISVSVMKGIYIYICDFNCASLLVNKLCLDTVDARCKHEDY
jgi:hypothetical protein